MFKNILDEYHVLAGSGGLSCVDLQDILDAHNTARQNVALGRIAGQPAAANMLEMVSDKKMADVSDCAERERERERIPLKGRHVMRKLRWYPQWAISQGFITSTD